MIAGYHVIFGVYGIWLPNAPRGSWSDFVGSWELFRYGPATKTTNRGSVAYKPHDRPQRLAAKSALKRPAVKLTGTQALVVGRSFGNYTERSGFPIWACAILPDHVQPGIPQSIRYVTDNPNKEGLLRQRWSFEEAFAPRDALRFPKRSRRG